MTVWTMIVIFCISIFVCLFNEWRRNHNPDAKRLAHLERRVNQIAKRVGMGQSPLEPQVQELIVQGRKINAIKLYREQTGAGLVEAREAVLRIEAQMKAQGLV